MPRTSYTSRVFITQDFLAIFGHFFYRVPHRTLTSDLHHRTIHTKPTRSEIMILECSFPLIPLGSVATWFLAIKVTSSFACTVVLPRFIVISCELISFLINSSLKLPFRNHSNSEKSKNGIACDLIQLFLPSLRTPLLCQHFDSHQ